MQWLGLGLLQQWHFSAPRHKYTGHTHTDRLHTGTQILLFFLFYRVLMELNLDALLPGPQTRRLACRPETHFGYERQLFSKNVGSGGQRTMGLWENTRAEGWIVSGVQ